MNTLSRFYQTFILLFCELHLDLILHLQYRKKIQLQRPKYCYCNADNTRGRPSSEIQAKY